MGWWGSSWARWARSQLGRGLRPRGWIRPHFLAEWVSRAGHEAQTRQTYVAQRGYIDFANGLGLAVCINGVDQERAGLMTKWPGLGEIQPGLNGTVSWGQISPIISPWRSSGFKWMQNNHISWVLTLLIGILFCQWQRPDLTCHMSYFVFSMIHWAKAQKTMIHNLFSPRFVICWTTEYMVR